MISPIPRRFWWTAALLVPIACLALVPGVLFSGARYSPATLGLLRATQTNRTADALRHLAVGAEVSALDEAERPPLFWAVLFGNDVLVTELLKRGADLRWTAPDGATLLYEAARWPVLEPAGTGRPAGQRPSLAGKARIVDRLPRAGLDPNAVDGNGSTPLHIATGLPLGGPEPRAIVGRLVAAGARALAANAFGLPPLDLARRRGAEELAAAMEQTR